MLTNKIRNIIKYIIESSVTKFEVSYNFLLRLVQLICGTALVAAFISLLVTYATITGWSSLHDSIRDDLSKVNVEYRNSLVVNKYEIMNIHAKALCDIIATEIETKYDGDYAKLKNDIDTYIEKNDKNNRLLHIFNDCSYDYINKWFTSYPNVRVIISNRNNFLFTSSLAEPLRGIDDKVPGVVFAQPPKTILVLGSDNTLNAHSVDYVVQNLEIDKDMEVFAVSYIYEHGDILGVRDVLPNGKSSENSKLAIILAYQPITEYHMHILEHTKQVISDSINDSYVRRALDDVWLIGIAFAVVIVFGIFWQILDEDYID